MNTDDEEDSDPINHLYHRHLKIMNQLPSQRQLSSKSNKHETVKKMKFKNLPTEADYNELRKAYKFIMPPISTTTTTSNANANANANANEDGTTANTESICISWQERMARQYHSHLFKTYAIADLSQITLSDTNDTTTANANINASPKVGLRWRIEREVRQGIGQFTCGNKHCKSFRTVIPYDKQRMELYFQQSQDYSSQQMHLNMHINIAEQRERQLLQKVVPYGMGLHSYEVNFQYVEDSIQKNEQVKLRLCMRCAPLLFSSKGGALGAKRAREENVFDTLQDQDATTTTTTGTDTGTGTGRKRLNSTEQKLPKKKIKKISKKKYRERENTDKSDSSSLNSLTSQSSKCSYDSSDSHSSNNDRNRIYDHDKQSKSKNKNKNKHKLKSRQSRSRNDRAKKRAKSHSKRRKSKDRNNRK